MSESTEKVSKKSAGLKSLPTMSGKPHTHKYEMHNEKFAEEDSAFRSACINAKVEPTARQASKWRNKKGSAYLLGR